MRIVRDWEDVTEVDRGAAAAIGNFDGVHLGHQAVIDIARAEAGASGAPLGVVTFEPHPREHFAPDAPPFRLMNAEARASRLDKLGVDILYELPFDGRLAGMSPELFVTRVLGRGLGLVHCVVGRDFRFGAKRAGDAVALRELAGPAGFRAHIADLVQEAGVEVSSTAIRAALSEGRPDEAARMLGHHHRIEGPVISGDRRGRTLGWPTANMSMDGLHPPRHGVYAVRVDLRGDPATRHAGVASIGTRPMFGENAPNLEVHLFDFAGDLYGRHLSVALVSFLRPEARFESVDALVAQMGRDADDARARLAG